MLVSFGNLGDTSLPHYRFFLAIYEIFSFYARNGGKKGVLSGVRLPCGNCIERNASNFDGRQCDLIIV